MDLFSRPTFVISLKNGVGKGSGRSVSDFNIHKGLAAVRVAAFVLLAGITVRQAFPSKRNDIDEFAMYA
ncbi:MAG: hypothetical protein MZU95_01680 [Desulfomicrobium escambiense]|nr:hypothetical protein [Desulfomicrobium escambiense]